MIWYAVIDANGVFADIAPKTLKTLTMDDSAVVPSGSFDANEASGQRSPVFARTVSRSIIHRDSDDHSISAVMSTSRGAEELDELDHSLNFRSPRSPSSTVIAAASNEGGSIRSSNGGVSRGNSRANSIVGTLSSMVSDDIYGIYVVVLKRI